MTLRQRAGSGAREGVTRGAIDVAATAMFMLVSRRYERRKPDRHLKQAVQRVGRDLRGRHGRGCRLIHHAEFISLEGDSYRLKDRDLGPCPTRPGDTD
jgi:DNA replication protein DnaC